LSGSFRRTSFQNTQCSRLEYRGLPMTECGRVAPLPKLNHYAITCSDRPVVLLEPSSQPPCLYTDDRVETRVKASAAPKNLRPDELLLQPVTTALYRLFDGEAQKAIEVLCG